MVMGPDWLNKMLVILFHVVKYGPDKKLLLLLVGTRFKLTAVETQI